KCVELGAELAATADTDLDVVENIYKYIIDNIEYDYDLAENVEVGYLPDIDRVLDEGKGICFDYAALATAMLRSQSIPTRLVIGYADNVYHAWISVYIEDVGWVNDVIEFKGTDWVRMDPTYDANASTFDKYIGSGANYHQMYLY
ncbi:MAG: transglutaminase-like domain-containing protein, partial [Bacillota bacterium]|nr:transglutaminase-like domain-containing protein [Bacillota bacterium]